MMFQALIFYYTTGKKNYHWYNNHNQFNFCSVKYHRCQVRTRDA